jgi:hypothetical protein
MNQLECYFGVFGHPKLFKITEISHLFNAKIPNTNLNWFHGGTADSSLEAYYDALGQLLGGIS